MSIRLNNRGPLRVSQPVESHEQVMAPARPRLEQAFQEFQPELLGVLVCMLGNPDDAQDALQESFVKCWQHRNSLNHINNLKAWIFRVTLNTGRDMRSAAWRRKRQALPEEVDQMVDRHPTPLEQAAAVDEWERIRSAVRQLRPEEQDVFLLRQNAGLTYEEIAETLHIPVGTVKTRMRMALAHIRSQIEGADSVDP